MSLIQAPTKYAHLTGNADLTYDAICKTISERVEQVDWYAFDQNDWQLFAQIADTEGVAPLLHWQVKSGTIKQQWPQEVKQFLQNSYYNTTAQNTLLFQELERILAAFDAAQIPVIVLKGASLAQTIYPDIGLRPMGDLDFLVHKNDLERSVAIVKGFGYDEIDIRPGFNKLFGHDVHLTNAFQHGVDIEIHWNLIVNDLDHRAADIEWFWNQTEPFHPNNNQSKNYEHPQMLNYNTQFLYYSAHLFIQHTGNQFRLLWLYDIYLLGQEKINWRKLLQQSIEIGWDDALICAIRFIRESFEYEINAKEKLLLNEYLLDVDTTRLKHSRKHKYLEIYKFLSWRNRLKLLFGIIFPSSTFIRWFYHPNPSWIWPIYYIPRWIDILSDGKLLIRLNRNNHLEKRE